MYLTEQEIMDQPVALQKTLEYMTAQQEILTSFFHSHPQRKFVLFGCGSSYMLAKSGQRMLAACACTQAYSIAGGDYLVNPDYYTETLRDAIVITLSRSGKTSEIVRAVRHVKDTLGCPVISISMQPDNDIMPMSDCDLTLDWCYDRSVCQTRTVTNLYAAITLLVAYYSKDTALEQAVTAAAAGNAEHLSSNRTVLEGIGSMDWDNAVVLADGAVTGLAEEGALAFTEIALLHGRCFNLLDYRHGPIVLNDSKTLTIALIQPGEEILQQAMVEDLKARGGIVVTVGSQSGNPYDVEAHVQIRGIERYEAWGIPFLFIMQMIAFSKALAKGGNPDQPKGLDAFIVLK